MQTPSASVKPARRGRPATLSHLSPAQRLERRRGIVARSLKKHRAAKKAAGVVQIVIELTALEAAELRALRKANVYAPEDFDKRALILGAKFCANMSQGKRPVARKRGTGGVRVAL